MAREVAELRRDVATGTLVAVFGDGSRRRLVMADEDVAETIALAFGVPLTRVFSHEDSDD